MTTTARAIARRVDRAARSDARLALVTVVVAVAAFAAFVAVPHALDGFAPPAGLEFLWATGAPLTMVLAPVAAGLAGVFSLAALWVHDLETKARRLHLLVLVVAAAFTVFLVSPPGRAIIAWWQD